MRQETELFKEKIEVSLDGRQVFYLFFGGAVIASLVFVLGVMVGRRVEARSHVSSAPIAAAAVDPLTALDQLGHRDHKSFRSALIDGDEDPRYEVDAAIADRARARAADQPGAEKSNTKKPSAKKPSAKKPSAKKPGAEKPSAEKPETPAPTPAKSPAAANQPTAQTPAPEKGADEPADRPKPASVKEAPEREEPALAKPKGPPNWTLQLSSFQDRVEADSFFDKLKSAGYSPYIVEAEVPSKGLYYRVRLGGYHSYDAAIEAKKAFEKSQGIIAYVTRLKAKSKRPDA